MGDRVRDDDGKLICEMCKGSIVVDCGYEEPHVHAYCAPCASAMLDEIMGAELPVDEQHLRAVVHRTVHDGAWVQAPAMGCVRVELARAYAASILRACAEAEAE